MSILDDVMQDDAAFAFTDADAFAEPVTVSNGTTSWTANVVVERFPPQPVGEGGTLRPFMRIHLANDATLGISATALDTGKYTVTVAYDKGGTAKAYRVHLPSEGEMHDAGMLFLDLW